MIGRRGWVRLGSGGARQGLIRVVWSVDLFTPIGSGQRKAGKKVRFLRLACALSIGIGVVGMWVGTAQDLFRLIMLIIC